MLPFLEQSTPIRVGSLRELSVSWEGRVGVGTGVPTGFQRILQDRAYDREISEVKGFPGKEKLGRHRDGTVNKRVALRKKETVCVELTEEMKRKRKRKARSVTRQPLRPHCWPLALAWRNAILSSFTPQGIQNKKKRRRKKKTNQEFQMSSLLSSLVEKQSLPDKDVVKVCTFIRFT